MYKNNPYNPWEIYLRDRRYCYIISPDGKTKQWIIFYARSCTHEAFERMIKDDIFIGTETHRGVEKIGRPLRDDLYWLYTVLAFVVLNKDYDDCDVMIDEAPETEPFFVRNYFHDYSEMLDFLRWIPHCHLAHHHDQALQQGRRLLIGLKNPHSEQGYDRTLIQR